MAVFKDLATTGLVILDDGSGTTCIGEGMRAMDKVWVWPWWMVVHLGPKEGLMLAIARECILYGALLQAPPPFLSPISFLISLIPMGRVRANSARREWKLVGVMRECLDKTLAIHSDDYHGRRFLVSEGGGGDAEMDEVAGFTPAASSSMSRAPPPPGSRFRLHFRPRRLRLLRPGGRSISYVKHMISPTPCFWASSSSSGFPASDSI